MLSLPEKILSLLASQPGLSDREITNKLRGPADAQQPINRAARALERRGLLKRKKRRDGIIGNYVVTGATPHEFPSGAPPGHSDPLAEDSIKAVLKTWLEAECWTVHVAWGKERGVDIRATRGAEVWFVEVKGRGSRPEMRVNYFIAVLGELLQRMGDAQATYSIALPDLAQFRRLWDRLPKEAKQRTRISALFVDEAGNIEPVNGRTHR